MDYPTEKEVIGQGQAVNYQYGQPVQPVVVQPAVVVNQVSPVVVSMPQLGLSPIATTCPFCRVPITTVVEQSFNCCALLLCCYTGFLIYACIQLCNNKSILCCDATHRCPNCGSIIGQYVAN